MAFLNALFTAALDNNLVFAQLVGMVSVVLVAGRPQDSWCFGGMVAVATAVAGAGWRCTRSSCSLGAWPIWPRSRMCS